MPQLDKFSFMPQIVWLLIAFLIIYFTLMNLILPQLSSVVKTRSKLLNNLKNNLVNFGDKELEIQKNYIENVNYFVFQTNYIVSHVRYLLDTHLVNISNYIKNVIYL